MHLQISENPCRLRGTEKAKHFFQLKYLGNQRWWASWCFSDAELTPEFF
jgi:hypothetical protein